MANKPLEQFLQNLQTFSQCLHTNLCKFFQNNINSLSIPNGRISAHPNNYIRIKAEKQKQQEEHLDRAFDIHSTDTYTLPLTDNKSSSKVKPGKPVSKEELGRVTWTLLHTIAAQFPDKPTKQQKHDAKELMAILSRIYPCKECSDHFKEVLKANPVEANSGVELAQWMCRVHNVVNRSLGKPNFPCQRVDARWGALECDDGCDLQGRKHSHV